MFEFNQFLLENEGLIHGAIKRCGIFSHHIDYEDFLQQGRLAMWLAYDKYPKKAEIPNHLAAFKNYLYQSVYWQLMDYLRKYYQKVPDTTGDNVF